MKKIKKMNKAVTVISVTAGIVLGTGLGVYAVAEPKENVLYTDSQMTIEAVIEPAEYKVNSNNMTYGIASLASNSEELPDLISAVGNNGVNGYILKSDFNIGNPTSPEAVDEYMEMKKKMKEQGINGFEVPLYAEDGVTVVDTFTIGKSNNNDILSQEYAFDKNGEKVILE